MQKEKFGPPAPPILKGVRNEDVWSFTINNEGFVPHFYKDTNNNVTVGIGKIISNVEQARDLPFDVMTDEKTPFRRATKKEVEKAFQKVDKSSAGANAKTYDPFLNPKFDKLYIPREVIESLTDQALRQSANELRQKIPRFDSIDPDAQKALLDMQYNMGDSRFNARKWPEFFSAIDMGDWKKAAEESRRVQVQEQPNIETKKLFLNALRRQQENRP